MVEFAEGGLFFSGKVGVLRCGGVVSMVEQGW